MLVNFFIIITATIVWLFYILTTGTISKYMIIGFLAGCLPSGQIALKIA